MMSLRRPQNGKSRQLHLRNRRPFPFLYLHDIKMVKYVSEYKKCQFLNGNRRLVLIFTHGDAARLRWSDIIHVVRHLTGWVIPVTNSLHYRVSLLTRALEEYFLPRTYPTFSQRFLPPQWRTFVQTAYAVFGTSSRLQCRSRRGLYTPIPSKSST